MIAQEQYDSIIDAVESAVTSRNREYWEEPLDPQKVADGAFSAGGCGYIDPRSRSEVFKFMTGMTFNQYLSQRVMMYAYKVLLEQEKFDTSELINITGVSTEGSFYKKFRDVFGKTPKQAFTEKDMGLWVPPSTWDTLGPEVKTRFKEVIKEVEVVREVEVVKKDRRPYIVVAAAAAALVIALAVYSWYSMLAGVSGEYAAFALCRIEGMQRPFYMQIKNEEWDLDAFSRKGSHSMDGSSADIGIGSVGRDSVAMSIALPSGECEKMEFTRFGNGTMETDMELEYEAGGYAVKTEKLRLIKKSDLEKWSEKWNGVYDMKDSGTVQDGVTYLNTYVGSYISIRLDMGNLILSYDGGDAEPYVIGRICGFDSDSLSFFFDIANDTVMTAVSTGDRTFETDLGVISDNETIYCTKIGSYDR